MKGYKRPSRKYPTPFVRDVEGYTPTELTNRISYIYNIKPRKNLRKQVHLALRRGVEYGILVKSKNKYRYDPEASLLKTLRFTKRRRRRSGGARSVAVRGKCGEERACTSCSDKKFPRKTQSGPKSVPKPTVPPPPNWTIKPRDLTTEPVGKVIKHRMR